MSGFAATLTIVAIFIIVGLFAGFAAQGEEDKACTEYGTCVITAPTEDSCPPYTGNVVPIEGGGVVCFPG